MFAVRVKRRQSVENVVQQDADTVHVRLLSSVSWRQRVAQDLGRRPEQTFNVQQPSERIWNAFWGCDF